MKTVNTDLGSFLKRLTAANQNVAASLTMYHDGKVFIVKAGEMSARSQHLDDALENLAEETRRRANGTQPMRDKPVETGSGTGAGGGGGGVVWTTVTLSGSPITISKTPTTITYHAAPTQYPTCPNCGKFPRGGWGACPGGWTVDCGCSHQWNLLLTAGQLVRLGQFEYRFDGQNLISTGAILTP